jgi:hypothetical protein
LINIYRRSGRSHCTYRQGSFVLLDCSAIILRLSAPLTAFQTISDCEFLRLMFVPCIIRRSRNNQNMHWSVTLLYSICWLLHISAVVCHHQETSGCVWDTWNTELMCGVSYNVRLCGLCAGVLWFRAQLESTTDGTTSFRHTAHIIKHDVIHHTLVPYFK